MEDRALTDGAFMTADDWAAFRAELDALIAKWKRQMQTRRDEHERSRRA